MRQGWMHPRARTALCCALFAATMSLVASAPSNANAGSSRIAPASEPSKRTEAPARTKRAGQTLRQFTGYVTALDATTVTVEKRGRNPETREFTKHDELHMTGEVAKDARVTVYYRDEGGRSIAHRIVAKAARTNASAARSGGKKG